MKQESMEDTVKHSFEEGSNILAEQMEQQHGNQSVASSTHKFTFNEEIQND
jgi:hypothetical protein